MYTTLEYYKHIQIVSWKLLFDSCATQLPIRITPIAKLYNLQHMLNYNATRWHNANLLSTSILDAFGLNCSRIAPKQLAIKLLAPSCILKPCMVSDAEEMMQLCDIPYGVAQNLCNPFNTNLQKKQSYTSSLEQGILLRFQPFIHEYLKANHR